MKQLLAFIKMVRLLYTTFFIAQDEREFFPIIELGPYNETDSTYSLVYLSVGNHPQHIHDDSDAEFYFHSGKGVIIVGTEKKEIPFSTGTVFKVSRKIPHGFRVEKEGIFMAWQSKAITNPNNGNRDVRYL